MIKTTAVMSKSVLRAKTAPNNGWKKRAQHVWRVQAAVL